MASAVLFANIISLTACLLLSLVIVQAHNQPNNYRSTAVKATNNGHPNSELKISHPGNTRTTKYPGKSHTSSPILSTRGILSKTTSSKTSSTRTSSKTSLSSVANAPHRYTARGSITNKRQDNEQIKSQTRITTLPTSSRKEEVTNWRSKDSSTTLTTPSTTLTTPSTPSTTPSTMSTTISSMLTDSFITTTESLTTLTDASTLLTNSPTALNNSIARLSDPPNTSSDSLTTLSARLPKETTTKRQNNGTYVFRKDQNKKIDVIKDAASPTPTYSQKFRYFTFNLDQMIADLANDSDKEVAGFFTTTSTPTAAPTAPTFPTLDDESLKNWQHLLPFILNTKAPLYLPPNIPVNIPAKSMPMTTQNPQLVKHELDENLQISSSESVMDERIKKLEEPKPIVLTFQKNTSGNNLLQDPVQDYPLEFGNMHPLQIRARDASLDLNDLAFKGVMTELPSLFKGHRKKVYQAKLILEELPYEELKTKYNADDEDFPNADYMLQESPRGALREMSMVLPYSSITRNNEITKINKIREAQTTSNEISPSRETKASTEPMKSTVTRASPAPIKYKKIIKKYIFKVPVMQLASNHANIKQTTPSTKSAAVRITHPGTMITKTLMKPKIITSRLHTDVNKNHYTSSFLTTSRFNHLPTLATIFRGTTKWHTYKPTFTKYIVKVTPRTTGKLRQMLTNRNFITPQYTSRSTHSQATQKPTTLNKIIHKHT